MTSSCSSNCLDDKSINTEPRENVHPEQKDWQPARCCKMVKYGGKRRGRSLARLLLAFAHGGLAALLHEPSARAFPFLFGQVRSRIPILHALRVHCGDAGPYIG
jgi:hypothetical protein